MGDPSSILPEQQEIMVALKQLFTAVETEVNKSTITPQIFHDILIHLEQTHDHFHKFEFVKILQRKVDSALSSIIETELNKRPNSDPLDVIPQVTEIVFSSTEFLNLQESFCQSMQEVIDVMVEIYHDPVRWEIGTPYLKNKLNHSYDDLSSSSNQTGCLFFTSEQYLQIAKNLDPEMPKNIRKNALNCLFKTAPGECEHWPDIRQGIMEALADSDYNFAEEALTLHAKLFNSGTSQSTSELYISLSGHLIKHFQDSSAYYVDVSAGVDTAIRESRCLLRRFMLLSIFQHDIPGFWIRCPERYMTVPITQTMKLLSLSPVRENMMLPVHFLSLYDHKALWFRKWSHSCFTRKIVIEAMREHVGILRNALESIKSFVIPDVAPKDVYSSFTYSHKQIKFLEFVHSISLVAYLVQYKMGRNLIRDVSGKDDGVSMVMRTLICNMYVNNGIFSQFDTSLDPIYFIAQLIREIVASGEECRSIISEEENLKALLKPLLENSSHSVSLVLAVCDILAIIISYSVGSNQLIKLKVTYNKVSMSGASFIGLLCKERLLATTETSPKQDKSILAGVLFLARQLYTHHHGLRYIEEYNILSLINTILSQAASEGDKTPQPHSPPLSLKDGASSVESEACFEEILIDNTLGFASTPKGLMALYENDMLGPCIHYLYQRNKKKLQVSKTQKFGYGYMVSQISGLPKAILALQDCGYIRQLSCNLWWLLENNGPPSPVEVPVTQPPDPYFEGVVLKATTSLLQVLVSYDSLHSILSAPAETVPLRPDICRQPEPKSFLDILDRIVFTGLGNKAECLTNNETMQIFGLRIISILLTCLDTLLYFVHRYDIIEFLVSSQLQSKTNGQIIVDEMTIERNQILVRSLILGGYGEKIIPPRMTETSYSFPLLDSTTIPDAYFPAKPSDTKDDTKLSNMVQEASGSGTWLDKTRAFIKAACRKPHFNGHIGLIELVLKYQLQENKLLFKQVEVARKADDDDDVNKKKKRIYSVEFGSRLLLDYGIRLGILPPESPLTDLIHVISTTAAALTPHQHKELESNSEITRFDWFTGVIYLLCGGNSSRTFSFLQSFSSTLTSFYVWDARAIHSAHVPLPLASSSATVLYYKLCHGIEHLLTKTLPMVSSAFRMSGLVPTHVVRRWLSSCFLNVLPWQEISTYILLVISEGPVYMALFCVAIFKHIKMKLLHSSTYHTLLYDILQDPIEDFHVGDYVDYMQDVDKTYGDIIREDVESIGTC